MLSHRSQFTIEVHQRFEMWSEVTGSAVAEKRLSVAGACRTPATAAFAPDPIGLWNLGDRQQRLSQVRVTTSQQPDNVTDRPEAVPRRYASPSRAFGHERRTGGTASAPSE